MAHAIQILAPNAPSGTAYFYEHDTSVPCVVYSDYACTAIVQGTASVTLDAAGWAVVYTNILTDVVVFDVNGTEVQRWTAGVLDTAVDTQSTSFTGTLPDGSQGVGGSVDLRTVLDQLTSSFGSTDWNVNYLGTPMTLMQALAASSNLNAPFFNVMDFGAQGDNSTDDTASVNATVAAASVSGGIVFFPEGTYKLTSTLVVGDRRVSLMGCGGEASTLAFQSASGGGIYYACGSVDSFPTHVTGLYIVAINGSTGIGVNVASTPGLVIERCVVEDYKCLVASTTEIHIRDCKLQQSNTDYNCVYLLHAPNVSIQNTQIVAGTRAGVTKAPVIAFNCDGLYMDGNLIDMTGMHSSMSAAIHLFYSYDSPLNTMFSRSNINNNKVITYSTDVVPIIELEYLNT